ncbi:GNAT family N-acetyltransferase [Homoserinibacter sp. YIM 151385]|uniref:GNAT family N-acetyltransferase n=1 Tax=Homoserinibacter sp. YIM 151385 TaxID=2985506 RepID=UPI0022F0FCD2|nr:GNAT family N-acetyltransferase [Homoserinibacter sp. YIM 151385]WBU39191.1 GNAT family N-acetyltransferase [Homoserinibacter sp. YIM 151385]
MSAQPFELVELPIPETLDGPGGEDFAATVEVRNAVEEEVYGTPEFAYSAAELLPGWRNQEHEPKRLLTARVDGRLVARAVLQTSPQTPDTAWLQIQVAREARRRGIGAALHARLESWAREAGVVKLLGWGAHPEHPGERLEPPTGFGSIPAGNAEVAFLLAHGWRLEQVERCSRLVLPAEPGILARHLAEAEAAAGPDYRVVTWIDRVADDWVEDLALLWTRMSTDAPSAGMEEPEEVYTAERVRTEEQVALDGGRTRLFAAAEHIPTGRLAGFTVLDVPPETHRSVGQEDTLVLREHRGHRLGMLVKLANIAFLEREQPGHPAITTFNAEENRHMLAVNEAVGFTAIATEGAWRKDLAEVGSLTTAP